MFLLILVCVLSGIGAGIGTGLAGLSAALIIAPSLMTFCDMPAYEAVTIALASDVLASAISAWTYSKSKNIDIKNEKIQMFKFIDKLNAWNFIPPVYAQCLQIFQCFQNRKVRYSPAVFNIQ